MWLSPIGDNRAHILCGTVSCQLVKVCGMNEDLHNPQTTQAETPRPLRRKKSAAALRPPRVIVAQLFLTRLSRRCRRWCSIGRLFCHPVGRWCGISSGTPTGGGQRRVFDERHSLSRRDSIIQLSVARHELRWVGHRRNSSTLKELNPSATTASCSPPTAASQQVNCWHERDSRLLLTVV